MQLNEYRVGPVTVVGVAGRLDAVTTPEFEACCRRLADAGAVRFVLDFHALEYINSGALRAIILLFKKVSPVGGKVVICGLRGTTKDVFDGLGFSEMFPIVDTVEQAAATMA